MSCIFKYSGKDKAYFLTVDKTIKSYGFIISKFLCRNKSKARAKKTEIFKLFCELGYIKLY